ncbi:DUF6287 domain-containing protein [Streptococcus cameli]
MKKKNSLRFLAVSSLVCVSLLTACSQKAKELPSASSNKPKTSQSVSKASSTPADTSKTTAATSQAQTPVATGMDLQAIAKGDYSSISGTWQNQNGSVLVFNQSGFVSGHTFTSAGQIEDHIYSVGVSPQTSVGGFQLLMIPKNVTIPEKLFEPGHSDTSDKTQDRMVGTQNALSKDFFIVYYKVSDSTEAPVEPSKPVNSGVTLSSGQETIDYANAILGESGWTVIEDNYNRTNVNPFNVVQSTEGHIYRIYQNGVIEDADGFIVYTP